MRFSPGRSVLWRSVDRASRAVHTVWPRIVVADREDLVALYLPAGTIGKQRTGERGGPRGRMLLRWDGGHRDIAWERTNVLTLYQPGDSHSIWLAWDSGSSELQWWYLNLEEPWRRTSRGFDTRDQILDAWAPADLASWEWKDEDELAWCVQSGRWSAEEAAAIRSAGERALDRARRRAPPLDEPWERWRPDPTWPLPTLGERWRDYDLTVP